MLKARQADGCLPAKKAVPFLLQIQPPAGPGKLSKGHIATPASGLSALYNTNRRLLNLTGGAVACGTSHSHPESSKFRAEITPIWGLSRHPHLGGVITLCFLYLVFDPRTAVLTPDFNCCLLPSLGKDPSGGDHVLLLYLERCLGCICQFPIIK